MKEEWRWGKEEDYKCKMIAWYNSNDFYRLFLREMIGSQKYWEDSKETFHIYLYAHIHRATIKNPTPECYICYNQWTDTDTLSPKVHSLYWGSLLVLHILWALTNVQQHVSHRVVSKTPLCSTYSSYPPP